MKTLNLAVICALFCVAELFAGPADTNGVGARLYKTIVDQDAGRYAVVDTSKEIVTLFDKNDKALWSTNEKVSVPAIVELLDGQGWG